LVAAHAKHPPRVDAELHVLTIEHDRRVVADAGATHALGKTLRARKIAQGVVPQPLLPAPRVRAGNVAGLVRLKLILAQPCNLQDTEVRTAVTVGQPAAIDERAQTTSSTHARDSTMRFNSL